MLPEYYHAYEVSVGKVAQLTSDTKKLVENMDRQCLTELRGQHSPSKEVEMLPSAVIIVGECTCVGTVLCLSAKYIAMYTLRMYLSYENMLS